MILLYINSSCYIIPISNNGWMTYFVTYIKTSRFKHLSFIIIVLLCWRCFRRMLVKMLLVLQPFLCTLVKQMSCVISKGNETKLNLKQTKVVWQLNIIEVWTNCISSFSSWKCFQLDMFYQIWQTSEYLMLWSKHVYMFQNTHKSELKMYVRLMHDLGNACIS